MLELCQERTQLLTVQKQDVSGLGYSLCDLDIALPNMVFCPGSHTTTSFCCMAHRSFYSFPSESDMLRAFTLTTLQADYSSHTEMSLAWYMIARQPARSQQAGMGVHDSVTLPVFKERHMLVSSRAPHVAGPVRAPDYLCCMLVKLAIVKLAAICLPVASALVCRQHTVTYWGKSGMHWR